MCGDSRVTVMAKAVLLLTVSIPACLAGHGWNYDLTVSRLLPCPHYNANQVPRWSTSLGVQLWRVPTESCLSTHHWPGDYTSSTSPGAL